MAFTLPIHVEVRGDPGASESFVLLHGYGGSSFSFRSWVPELTRRGQVVLVDMKGFGAAPKPDDDHYGPTDQAELIHRLLMQRDLARVTLVGHSLGGAVALITALRLLDEGQSRLARLVLVAGAAYRQKLPPAVALARRPRLSRALMRLLGARFIVGRVLRSIVYAPSGVTRSQVEGYAEPLSSPEAHHALVRTALQLQPEDLGGITSRYRELDVPALLLWGRHDRVVPLQVGERLSRALPRAELVVLDECGHLPAEELPVESLEAVTAFLDAHPLEAAAPKR